MQRVNPSAPPFPNMNILVFDTETTSLQKPFCYNVGYVIYNTDSGETLASRDYVIEQIWHNFELFSSAYYADKRPLYIGRMRGRSCQLEKFGYVTQQMARDIKEYDIEHAFAYNADFDIKVFDWNCDWFKCINPLETVSIHDIWGHVHETIAFTPDYQSFCEEHELFTETGNYSTNAESVYQYLTGDIDFAEEHTARADSIIECAILAECVKRGTDWTTDYKVKRSVPRRVEKEFTVEVGGTVHSFPYFTKRATPTGVKLK